MHENLRHMHEVASNVEFEGRAGLATFGYNPNTLPVKLDAAYLEAFEVGAARFDAEARGNSDEALDEIRDWTAYGITAIEATVMHFGFYALAEIQLDELAGEFARHGFPEVRDFLRERIKRFEREGWPRQMAAFREARSEQ